MYKMARKALSYDNMKRVTDFSRSLVWRFSNQSGLVTCKVFDVLEHYVDW